MKIEHGTGLQLSCRMLDLVLDFVVFLFCSELQLVEFLFYLIQP